MKTRLRVLRAEKEWSQAELAESVGVTRQCINAIETGKYEPGLDSGIQDCPRIRQEHRGSFHLSRRARLALFLRSL